MFVSHFASETRHGYTALLSSRYTEILEALRRALSPADFAFAQKVGLTLFDRLEPEAVTLAGMTSAFVRRPLVRDTAYLMLDAYERSLAESAFAIFSYPIGTVTPSPGVDVIVRTLALTILSESSATRPTPLSQSPSEHWTTAESLHR